MTSHPTDFRETALQRLSRRAAWRIRDTRPDRKVVRTVQGVRMTLPWAHRLPDYAGEDSPYGQDLAALARLLHDGHEPVVVIDAGDSALQIAHATDAEGARVEGDPYYPDVLVANTGGDPRFHLEPALHREDTVAGRAIAAHVPDLWAPEQV